MKNEIRPYIHKVQFYETDGMGIVHHANYIRWLEEARTDYLEQAGMPYDKLEERGIQFPVLEVSCKYHMAVPFGGSVKILPQLEWFDGLRYEVTYRISSIDDQTLHAEARTMHCFLDANLRPMRVARQAPDIFESFCDYAAKLRGSARKARERAEQS